MNRSISGTMLLLALVGSAWLVAGCSGMWDPVDGEGELGLGTSVVTLEARRTYGTQVQLGLVLDFLVLPEYIVALDVQPVGSRQEVIDEIESAKPFLVVLDRSTGETLRMLGRIGQGPGELERPISLSLSERKIGAQSVWVLEGGTGALSAFDVGNDDWAPYEETRLEGTGIWRVFWVSDNHLLGNVFSADALFGHFAFEGAPEAKRIREVGRSPFADVPFGTRLHLNRHRMTYSQVTKLIAAAFLYTDLVEVRNGDGILLHTRRGGREVEPELRTVSGRTGSRFVHTDGTRFAYISLDSTEDRIYALFSGRKARLSVGGREVDVFDWEGRLLGRLRLPREAAEIRVVEEGARETLFALETMPDTRISKYPVPSAIVEDRPPQ